MTTKKIKKIQFVDGTGIVPRAVRVTLEGGLVICIEAYSNGFRQFGAGDDELMRTVLLAKACLGYLQGNEEESLSYEEIAYAEDVFDMDLALPKFEDEDTMEQARFDFIDKLAHHQEWNA